MDAGHDLVPDLGRQTATGDAGQRRVVVVAHPDTGHVIGGEADEPRIPGGLCRPRLAGGGTIGQPRARAGALGDHSAHHVGQLARGVLADHPLLHPAFLPDQGGVVPGQPDLDHAVGIDGRAAVENAGIGARHLDESGFRRAQRQRRTVGEVAVDPEFRRHAAHQIAAHLFGQPHRGGVERPGQRLGQRHLAVEISRVVGRA